MTVITVCVTSSTRRFGKRSAIAPENGDSSGSQIICSVVTRPSAVAEPGVSWVSTSQSLEATRAIQPPVFDSRAPMKKNSR